MASGGRSGRSTRPPARSASVVVPLSRARAPKPELTRLLPSTRSLLVGFAVIGLAFGCYFIARDSSVFAVRTIDVEGAPPAVAAQVREALAGEVGGSLLRVDRDAVRQRILAVPTVAAASLDRAFPHTLEIAVVAERPVAVARQGADAWLLSARGRVIAQLQRHARPQLPRLWVSHDQTFTVGGMVGPSLQEPLAALTPLAAAHLPARVASVRTGSDELTLLLRSGLELRLGDATDVPLKLAVAAKVLPLVANGTRYVDVSVPERPVAGSLPTTTLKSKVEVETQPSTTP